MRRLKALFVILMLVAVACGGGDDAGPGDQATEPEGQPDPNAAIRVAAAEDSWPTNGEAAKATHFAYVLNANVYEPLVYLKSDYTLEPGLAERWELQPDGKTWRFFLRRGVTFHDGSPFTAEDVLWTWGTRQLEGMTLSTVANTLGPESVKKVDDFTVDFTPVQPNLRIPEQIVHPEGAIVKAGTHNDTPPYAGTGPFKVVSYTRDQTAVLERNDDYWGDKAEAQRIDIRFLPDPQTRLEALRSGQVDFVIDLPADAARSLESDDGFRVVRSDPGRNHLIYLNKSEGKVTANKEVRRAIALALDREAYVDVVLDGNGDPGRWMAPESVLGSAAEEVEEIRYDPEEAAEALEDAGWTPGADGIREKEGARLSVALLGTQEVPETALLFIQSQLEEVGIATEIKKTPDAATRNSLYKAGEYDLDLEPPNQNDGNPAFLPVLRMYSKNTGTAQFAPGAEFDAVAEKALGAKSTEAVQEASAQMMAILSNEEFIVVPMAGVYRIYGMSANVGLGDPHPSFTNQSWSSLSMTTDGG